MDVEAVNVGEDFYDKKDLVDFSPVIEKRSVEFESVGNRRSLRLRKKMSKVFGSLRERRVCPGSRRLVACRLPRRIGTLYMESEHGDWAVIITMNGGVECGIKHTRQQVIMDCHTGRH